MTIQSEFNETMHMLMNVYKNNPLNSDCEITVYRHGKGLYGVFDGPNDLLVLVFADSVEDAKKKACNGVVLPVDLEELGIESGSKE